MHKITGSTSNYREKRGKFPIENRKSRTVPSWSTVLSLKFFIESMNSRSASRAWINGHLLRRETTRLRKLFVSLTFRKQRPGTSNRTNYRESAFLVRSNRLPTIFDTQEFESNEFLQNSNLIKFNHLR